MKIMTLAKAAEYLSNIGLDVSEAWVRKMAEPDADGRRGIPAFKLTGGKTAQLYTTDEALETHLRHLAAKALEGIHGPNILTLPMHSDATSTMQAGGERPTPRSHIPARRAGSAAPP